jgi:site-specific DNA-methyltransferase (adenine-specific)
MGSSDAKRRITGEGGGAFRPRDTVKGLASISGQTLTNASEVHLVRGDAIHLATWVPPKSAMLAYLDPPFAVGASFRTRSQERAYEDRWPSLGAYLDWLDARIRAVRCALSDQGTMWLHLDHRAVHQAKVLCDEIFGKDASVGEIVWVPGNGSKARRGPGITHQTILVYAAGEEYVWNTHDPALRAPFASTSLSMHFTKVDSEGRRYRDRVIGGKTYRYYADRGRALGSVWTDCPSMLANTPLRNESTGYPTQKPLKLLERIVRASSLPGALVIDPFCGSGTTLEAATRLGRRAFGCDIGEAALSVAADRLRAAGLRFSVKSTARPMS